MTTPMWSRRKRTMAVIGTNNNKDASSSLCDIAMSRIETTILTPSGDILVCRSRDSEFMTTERASVWVQQEHEEQLNDVQLNSVVVGGVGGGVRRTSKKEVDVRKDLGVELCSIDASFCNPCSVGMPERGGLLGGAAPEEESMMDVKHNYLNRNDASTVVISNTKENCASICDDLAAPPSFDYSHLGTTSFPERTRIPLEEVSENKEPDTWDDPSAGFSKLFGSLMAHTEADVSGHTPAVTFQAKAVTPETLRAPSVMHGVPTCLLTLSEIRISQISAHPLGSHVLLISSQALLFAYGQNDHGQLGLGTPLDTFVRSPTLVTAILEGGGKALSCSAGVRHSLIVVKTEEQRVIRNKNFALQRVISSPPRLGYSNNNNSSLAPKNPDDLILYHHQVYGFGASRNLGLMNPPNEGAACMSLPHRVALHAKVWPEQEEPSSMNDNGGLPPAGVFQVVASVDHSAALVRRATGAIELYTWGEESLALGGGMTRLSPSVPTKVDSLSSKPPNALAITSDASYLKDSEHLQQLYLGPDCTFVMTNTGRCMSFGTDRNGLLGIGKPTASVPTDISFPTEEPISSVSIGAQHAMATSSDGKVYVWGADPASKRTMSRPEPQSTSIAVMAFAGYDASALVTQSGILQTCGKQSGRLGQGEVPPNPRLPTRLFGGLRLWREQQAAATADKNGTKNKT